jgi:hypothetical protein
LLVLLLVLLLLLLLVLLLVLLLLLVPHLTVEYRPVRLRRTGLSRSESTKSRMVQVCSG